MRAASIVCLALGLLVLTPQLALAAERGTEAEAKALLQKAAAHYQSVGREQALADFNRKDGGFVDRDLYVWCYDKAGSLVVHGANPKLRGLKVGTLKDAEGKDFTNELYNGGMTKGSGVVDYKWTNPVTRKIEAKASFYQKIGEDVCAVGYYK